LLECELPILGVSYGGNDPAGAEMPADWGTEVPLTFMRATRIVVVAPARDRPLEEHLELGEAIGALPGRVAVIASADHGHAHDPDGPYGFDPAAAAYDAPCRRSSRPNASTSFRSPSTSRRGRPTPSGSSSSCRARWAKLRAPTSWPTPLRRTTGWPSQRYPPSRREERAHGA